MRKKKKLKCVTYLAVKNNKSVLLIQRKDKSILKDQWELPSTDWSKEETHEINLNSPIKNTKWKKSEINFNHSFTQLVTSLSNVFPSSFQIFPLSFWVSVPGRGSYLLC